MVQIKKSIEIDAPVEEVFEFFSNPENLPEVWPSMVEVSNVDHGPDGHRGFDWVYKMAGIRFRGHSETLEWKENERVVSRNKEGIKSTFTYDYEGIDDRTRLTVSVEYEIPNKVLAKLAGPFVRRINEHEAEVLLENLKARMELTGQEAEEPRYKPETRPHT